MSLSGSQIDELQDALLSAFDEPSLAQMVRIRLDENLPVVAGGANLSEVVFNLISWAERTGRTEELIAAACAQNPANPALRTFATRYPAALSPPAGGGLLLYPGRTGGRLAPVNPLPALTEAELQDLARRQVLRSLVKQYWIDGVLAHSLNHEATIQLGLVDQPDLVANRPWRIIPPRMDEPGQQLPAGTSIADVFDQVNQRLLILGEPGSGKTTLLLELARTLLARADAAPILPSPVVLNLSSWIARRASLAVWLVEELNVRYNIPKKLASAWVEHDKLLLLLDGLDEVQPQHRSACVQAINDFTQQHLVPMAVCCRTLEYESLNVQLKLHGAVLLQPLTDAQVETYLSNAGPTLDTLRSIYRHDRELRVLAQSPLMLSIMVLAYQGMSPAALDLPAAAQSRRQHLFDTYIQRMFSRRMEEPFYPPRQMIRWLQWLAVRLGQYGQTVYLIERMQPDWLDSPQQRRLHAVGVTLLASLPIGILFGLGVGLPVAWSGTPVQGVWLGILSGVAATLAIGFLVRRLFGMASSSVVGALLGLAFGWPFSQIYGGSVGLVLGGLLAVAFGLTYWFIGRQLARQGVAKGDQIVIIDKLDWSRARAAYGAAAGFACGLVASLALWWAISGEWYIPGFAPFFALAMSVPAAAVSAVLVGLRGTSIETNLVPNQGIRRSAANALRIGLTLWVAVGIPLGVMSGVAWALALGQFSPYFARFTWPVGITVGICLGGAAALTGALLFGGQSCLQHWLLRFQLRRCGDFPWRCVRFLDDATEYVFLQRVGGGYSFVHRLIMEHFAVFDSAANERLAPAARPSLQH